MARARSMGRWVGGLASAGVVGGAYLAGGLAALLFTRVGAEIAMALAFGLVAVHAFLRPTRRGEVLNLALAPAIMSNVAAAIFGIRHAWVTGPLAVLVVAILAYDDREEERAKPSQPA